MSFYVLQLGGVLAFLWERRYNTAKRKESAYMNQDLTVGKPSRVLIKFCLPLLGSMFFQQLYNLADSLIVGKFVGENALAAVGNSYEITLVFIAFAFGVNVGCSVIAGQLFGGREYGQVRTAVYTTFLSGGVLCALLMAVITGCMHGVNLMLIGNLPAYFAKYGKVSTVSGLLNACTYIGSALSTYGFAALSDRFGWGFTIAGWAVIAGCGMVICLLLTGRWTRFCKE